MGGGLPPGGTLVAPGAASVNGASQGFLPGTVPSTWYPPLPPAKAEGADNHGALDPPPVDPVASVPRSRGTNPAPAIGRRVVSSPPATGARIGAALADDAPAELAPIPVGTGHPRGANRFPPPGAGSGAPGIHASSPTAGRGDLDPAGRQSAAWAGGGMRPRPARPRPPVASIPGSCRPRPPGPVPGHGSPPPGTRPRTRRGRARGRPARRLLASPCSPASSAGISEAARGGQVLGRRIGSGRDRPCRVAADRPRPRSRGRRQLTATRDRPYPSLRAGTSRSRISCGSRHSCCSNSMSLLLECMPGQHRAGRPRRLAHRPASRGPCRGSYCPARTARAMRRSLGGRVVMRSRR